MYDSRETTIGLTKYETVFGVFLPLNMSETVKSTYIQQPECAP